MFVCNLHLSVDFSGGSDANYICLQCRRPRFKPRVGKIFWRRKWQTTPVLLSGKFHGRRNLVGYSPISVELFKIPKGDAVKVLHSVCQQIWKTLQWPQAWKRSIFIPIPKKGNVKECSDYGTSALISHASKVMFKILQARFQQYVNHELPDVQAGFRKGRGTRDQIANICWIIEKAREFQENIYFCFIDYAKVFDCVDHNKLENS